jgi:hypothetical protein
MFHLGKVGWNCSGKLHIKNSTAFSMCGGRHSSAPLKDKSIDNTSSIVLLLVAVEEVLSHDKSLMISRGQRAKLIHILKPM